MQAVCLETYSRGTDQPLLVRGYGACTLTPLLFVTTFLGVIQKEFYKTSEGSPHYIPTHLLQIQLLVQVYMVASLTPPYNVQL